VTLGPAVVARLRRSQMDRDITLWLNAPKQELIIEKGAVTGAVVQRDGGSQRIRARRGVLIATGGFSHNVALREKHQQAPTGCAWTAAAPGATGDGITMGEAAGAALEFMHCAWWSSSGRCGNLATPRVNPWERRVLTAQVKPAEKRLRLQRQSRLE
jgi:3-oxosteroid 1-dehydrogenase